jgi:hypothetical protein
MSEMKCESTDRFGSEARQHRYKEEAATQIGVAAARAARNVRLGRQSFPPPASALLRARLVMDHFGHSVDIISAHRIEQFVIWYSMRIQASHVVKERRASRDFRQRDAKADGNATASAGTTAGAAERAGRQSREPQLCALASTVPISMLDQFSFSSF